MLTYRGIKYAAIFFLIERSKNEAGQTYLQLIDASQDVKDLLGDKWDKQYWEVKEDFWGVPAALGKILRDIRKNTDLALTLKTAEAAKETA